MSALARARTLRVVPVWPRGKRGGRMLHGCSRQILRQVYQLARIQQRDDASPIRASPAIRLVLR